MALEFNSFQGAFDDDVEYSIRIHVQPTSDDWTPEIGQNVVDLFFSNDKRGDVMDIRPNHNSPNIIRWKIGHDTSLSAPSSERQSGLPNR